MIKYLSILLLACALGASDVYDIVSEYRKNGINSIKSTLEQYLISKEYWQHVVRDMDVRFGYYESVRYVFLAQKSNESVRLFRIDENGFAQISQAEAMFGENRNDKKKQGDLATPIGVYDLTSRLDKLDQYYGPLAFTTSYPNLYDKLNKKTGHGIWIHGKPLNNDRTEKDTKGCIVVENDIISHYDKQINYKNAILITSQNALKEVARNDIVAILHSLFVWCDAWINNDLDLYLSFYDDNFRRFDGMKIENFKAYKRRVFAKAETKTINFKDIDIAPYPNTQNLNMFRVTFIEDYKADSGYAFNGQKELYVIVANDSMKIIAER